MPNKYHRAGLKRGGGKFPDYSGDGKITMRDIFTTAGMVHKLVDP